MEAFLKDLAGNFLAVMKKYFVFAGRAGRKEFWYFVLAGILIGIAFSILTMIPLVGFIVGLVSFVFGILTFIPSLAVGVRRLQGTNKSGWLLLLMLIPLVGWIIVIVFWVFAGTPGKNKYGLAPADNKPLKKWSELKDLKDVFKGKKEKPARKQTRRTSRGKKAAK